MAFWAKLGLTIWSYGNRCFKTPASTMRPVIWSMPSGRSSGSGAQILTFLYSAITASTVATGTSLKSGAISAAISAGECVSVQISPLWTALVKAWMMAGFFSM